MNITCHPKPSTYQLRKTLLSTLLYVIVKIVHIVFLHSVLGLLGTANVVPSSLIVVT
jgi:hypothetical protein